MKAPNGSNDRRCVLLGFLAALAFLMGSETFVSALVGTQIGHRVFAPRVVSGSVPNERKADYLRLLQRAKAKANDDPSRPNQRFGFEVRQARRDRNKRRRKERAERQDGPEPTTSSNNNNTNHSKTINPAKRILALLWVPVRRFLSRMNALWNSMRKIQPL